MPYLGKNFDPNYQNRQVQQVGNYKGRNYDPNFQYNKIQSQEASQRPFGQIQQQKPISDQNKMQVPQQRFQNNQANQNPQFQHNQPGYQQPYQQYNNQFQGNNNNQEQKQAQAKFYSMDSIINFINVSDEIKLPKNKDKFFQIVISAKQNQLAFHSLKAGQVDFIFRINMVKTNDLSIELYITDLLYTGEYLFVATNYGVYGCKMPQLTAETQVNANKPFGNDAGQTQYKITEPNFTNLQTLQIKKISSTERVCRDLHFSQKDQMLSFIEGEFDYVNDTFVYTTNSSLQLYQINKQQQNQLNLAIDSDPSGINSAVMINILSCKNMYIMAHCDGMHGEIAFIYKDLTSGELSLSMIQNGIEIINCKLFPEEKLHHHLNFHQMFRLSDHQAFILVSQQNSIVSILFNEATHQVTQQFIMKDGSFYGESGGIDSQNNCEILNLQQFDTYFVIHCKDGRMLKVSLTAAESAVQHSRIQRLFNPAKLFQMYKQERNQQRQRSNSDGCKDGFQVTAAFLSRKSTLTLAFLEGDPDAPDAKATLCFHQLKENRAIDVEKEITLLL